MPKKVRPAGDDWRLKVRMLKVNKYKTTEEEQKELCGKHKGGDQPRCVDVILKVKWQAFQTQMSADHVQEMKT